MSTAGFTFCMAVQRAQASLRRKLDSHASLAECAQPLGLPRPAVLQRVLALEKIGLVERRSTHAGRQIAIRPAGKTLAHNARETIDWLCGQALTAIEPASIASAEASLHTFAQARVLTAR